MSLSRELWRTAAVRDDEPSRRVLADWLLEQGDDGGYLIQVQLELCGVTDPERLLWLKTRERTLLGQQWRLWAQRFGADQGEVLFDRGVPVALELRQARLQRSGDFEALLALLDSPYLSLLRSLRLENNRLGPAGAARVAANPSLDSLRELAVVENQIGVEGLLALADAPGLRGLSRLDLAGNALGLAGARAWSESALADSLPVLGLARNRLGDEGVAALRSGCTSLDLASNHLGRDGAEALGHGPLGQRLEVLSLAYNPLGAAGLGALGPMPALRSLDLAGSAQLDTLEGLEALLDQAQIRSLGLGHSGLQGTALRELLQIEPLAQIRSLDLHNNQLDATDVWALVDAPVLADVSELGLSKNNLTDVAVLDLGAEKLRALTSLDLRHNMLTPRGIRSLAQSLPPQVEVQLAGNRVSTLERDALLADFGPRLTF